MNTRIPDLSRLGAGDTRMMEVAGALSLGLDLASGQELFHSARAAYLAQAIAEEMHLSDQTQADVLYGCLLADLGCTQTSARWAELLEGEELALAREMYFLDPGHFRSMLKTIWSVVAPTE